MGDSSNKNTFQVAAWAIGVCTSLLFGYDAMVTEKLHEETTKLRQHVGELTVTVTRIDANLQNSKWTLGDQFDYERTVQLVFDQHQKAIENLERRQERLLRLINKYHEDADIN